MRFFLLNICWVRQKQAAVSIAALLAAFPTTFGAWGKATPTMEVEQDEHQQMHPLVSGSVCRVRDSLDFLSVSDILFGSTLRCCVVYSCMHVFMYERVCCCLNVGSLTSSCPLSVCFGNSARQYFLV